MGYLGVLIAAGVVSLFPPRVFQFLSPGQLGYPQENVRFETEDGVSLAAWWVPQDGNTVVIACHGYLVNRSEWVSTITFFGPKEISCLFFDHRRQGSSGGDKIGLGQSERADVHAAIEFVKSRKPEAKIVLLGSSLGGVAAVLAAAERPDTVDALILDSPYRTLDEALRGWWPFLLGKSWAALLSPTRWVARLVLGFRPADVRVDKALRKLHDKPILLSYGDRDPLVPKESIERMVESAGPDTHLLLFEGATHGAGRMANPARYRDEVLEFLRSYDLIKSEKKVASEFRDSSY